MLTPEEVEERKNFVGASDAGSIIGLNPYASAWDVYAEKTGVEIDKSAMEERWWWGSYLEPVIVKRFEELKGMRITKPDPVIHPLHPWLRASPDGFVFKGDARIGGFEAKTVTTFQEHMWGEDGTSDVPPHVRIQCEIGMACTGLDVWDVAALSGSFSMKTYRIHRPDDEDMEALIKALGHFWHEHVLPRNPPPMDGSDGAKAWLREMYPRDERPLRHATTAEELEAIDQYIEAKQAEKVVKAMMGTARNTLALHVGDAGGLICSKGTVTFKANKNGVRSFRTKLEGLDDD